MSDNTSAIRQTVVDALGEAGYRPFGSAGDGFEHPTGTRVTMGWSGGQVRVRRFALGNDRFRRVPPTTWDLKDVPPLSEVRSFITPDLSKAERARVARFESSGALPESFEAQDLYQKIRDAIDMRLAIGDNTAEQLTDAVFLVLEGK